MTMRILAPYENHLHEAAIRKTGLDDFGDTAYRQGLRVLLDAFDSDLRLSQSGWQAAYGRVLHDLIARLYTQKGWAAHPEVFATEIRRPFVIVGLPRTGTTALHRLLSVDPQFQGLEAWLVHRPTVRPPREAWEIDSAYRACVANLEGFYARTPAFRKVHDVAAGDVEECTGVLTQSFVSTIWSVYNLPTYARWILSQSARQSYLRYVDVLRLIGARDPHKRWLLKSPFHMVEIGSLLEVFPDACIIQTHRDPLKAIPSFCSLLYVHGRTFEGEAARSDVLGSRQCAYWRTALDRMQTARQKSRMQFFDVEHSHFVTDPLETVRSIYENFGLTFSPRTEQDMRAWIAANPTSKHGKHEYAAQSWGVTPDQICETFAEYRARHQFN